MARKLRHVCSKRRSIEWGPIHEDSVSPVAPPTAANPLSCRAVLLDFGMAKSIHQSGSFRPTGTPHFVAPEQARFEPVPASDVYGLGALLWWAVCGVPMRTDRNGRPLSDPRQLNPDISSELAELLVRMVHVVPDVRPTLDAFMEVWPHFAVDLDRAHDAREARAPSVVALQFDTPVSAVVASPSSRREEADDFVGEMPELLSALSAAVDVPDRSQMSTTLKQIEHAAEQATATDIARLARMYHALMVTEPVEATPASIVDELEAAYLGFFQALSGPTTAPSWRHE